MLSKHSATYFRDQSVFIPREEVYVHAGTTCFFELEYIHVIVVGKQMQISANIYTVHCSILIESYFIIYPGAVNLSTKSQLLFNKIKISTHIPLNNGIPNENK
jgi:hypothetical protein